MAAQDAAITEPVGRDRSGIAPGLTLIEALRDVTGLFLNVEREHLAIRQGLKYVVQRTKIKSVKFWFEVPPPYSAHLTSEVWISLVIFRVFRVEVKYTGWPEKHGHGGGFIPHHKEKLQPAAIGRPGLQSALGGVGHSQGNGRSLWRFDAR